MAVPTPNKKPSLPSVRTFANDLAKQRGLVGENKKEASVVEVKDKPLTTTKEKAEEQTYRAPSWTANKKTVDAPVAKKETLTPIAAAKKGSETILVDAEKATNAVTIKDAKKARFRLFPAIFSAIKGWFAEQKSKQEAKKTPLYSVPDTSRRKGVIQKATSKTGKITSADHLSIHERVRQRKERAVPKTPVTIWTANTEPGFPLLEAPEAAVSNVKVVPKKSFRTTTAVVKEEIKVVPAPAPITPIAPTVNEPVVPETKTVELEVPTAVPVIAKVETPQQIPVTIELPEDQVVEEVMYETESEPTESVTKLKPTNLREWLFSINTNTISIGIAGLCFALLLVSGVTYVWYKNQPEPQILVEEAQPILANTPLIQIYGQGLEAKELYKTITDNKPTDETAISHLIFIADQMTKANLKPEFLLEQLELTLDGSFSRSINNIYFGTTGNKASFIIFQVSDQNTAQGGMLAWENSLYQETQAFFNHDYRNDPGSIKTAVFSDSIIGDTDVRILKTLAGAEMLVYGLVNRETIIITTDSETFTRLTNLIN